MTKDIMMFHRHKDYWEVLCVEGNSYVWRPFQKEKIKNCLVFSLENANKILLSLLSSCALVFEDKHKTLYIYQKIKRINNKVTVELADLEKNLQRAQAPIS